MCKRLGADNRLTGRRHGRMHSLPVLLIDAHLVNFKKSEDLVGDECLVKQLTKTPIDRILKCRNGRTS